MSLHKFLFLLLFIVSLGTSSQNLTTTPENALNNYLHNNDQTFGWKVNNQLKTDGVTIYQLIFTSQQWRGIVWKHELFINVPDNLSFADALLFITGGGISEGEPRLHKMDDELVVAFAQMAIKNQAITSVIYQVPNQPLYGDRTEDELISYTYHNFMNDGDYTWPLLFPMTKSAIKAMDVIQQFAQKELNASIQQFVVSGGSKRGWTTWLTGASDLRVKAIAPMVIDVLNMPVSIEYHRTTWGDYSVQIQDYVDLGIAQQMETESGKTLVTMVDPFSYRDKLTMPKMLIMGTNDEYWPVDAVKNYIDQIPGNNHLCYIANAGHGLGDKRQALNTLSAFFANTITNSPYPKFEYTPVEIGGKIKVHIQTTADKLLDVRLFTSYSNDREFRDKKWSSESLKIAGKPSATVELNYPNSGFMAFYVELLYQAPMGHEYTETTRVYLSDPQKLYLGINE